MNDDERRARMEAVVRTYFDGCNEADREKMVSCLAPNADHYFPDGSPFGVFRGAEGIARGWQAASTTLGAGIRWRRRGFPDATGR